MRANRAYHLIVSRDRLAPSFLTTDDVRDRIELVSIDDGEVVLFWSLPAKAAGRMLRELRADLAGMEAESFLEKWSSANLPS